MTKEKRMEIIKNRIEFCIKTGRHKKQLKILKKELANLS